MVRPGVLTHAHRADGHSFNRTGEWADGHQVAGVHPIFELNKDHGNNIFYQRLRAERDSQPQRPGPGQ